MDLYQIWYTSGLYFRHLRYYIFSISYDRNTSQKSMKVNFPLIFLGINLLTERNTVLVFPG